MKKLIQKSDRLEDDVEKTHERIANIARSKVAPRVGRMNVSTRGVIVKKNKLKLYITNRL